MMNAVAQAALSLSAFPLSVLLKATVILGVAFLILRGRRTHARLTLSQPAETRFSVQFGAQGAG